MEADKSVKEQAGREESVGARENGKEQKGRDGGARRSNSR
jgi:hypothetical protein